METDFQFYEAVINAGAIIAGFCSTFLVFRIQREANYYRQPVLNYEQEKAKDVFIGLTHFTSSFLLIILAAVLSMVFGFVIPLLGMAGVRGQFISPKIVVAGLMAALILLAGYLYDEMVHYNILGLRLVNDASEWGKEWPIVIIVVLLAFVGAIMAYILSG